MSPSRRLPESLSPRSVFWLTLVAFFLLTTAWSLANPLMASPDEQSHLKKAAATAYGQIINREILVDREVTIPEIYSDAGIYLCNAFQPEVPISACDDSIVYTQDYPGGWTTAPTPAARYNPLYYALIGWPALISHSVASIYAMRVLSGLLAAFFYALGFRALRQARMPALGVIAATACITPMAAFLAGSINPQSLEISAAFAVWCQMLVLIRTTEDHDIGKRMWLLAFIASVFANSRGLSPFFLALIVVCTIALQPWRMSWRIISDKRSWGPIALTLIATLAASAWIVSTGVLTSSEPPPEPQVSRRWLALYTLRQTDAYLQHAVGSFGWLHVPLPMWAVVLFLSAFLGALALVLAYGTRRDRIVLFSSLIITCLVVPILLHASQAKSLGIMWQGRYILPMFIGIPVMAAFIIADRAIPQRLTGSRLVRAWALVFGSIHAFAVIFEMHRHMLGMSGTWDLRQSQWFPPIPLWLLGLVLVAFIGLIVLVMDRMSSIDEPDQLAHASANA